MNESLKTKVFETLGTVSMCWSETPKGEFDGLKAEQLGNELCDEIDKNTLKDSVERLCWNLKKDENYFYSWQANIAMAFQDEYWNTFNRGEATGGEIDKIHRISNEAAKNFLNILINS